MAARYQSQPGNWLWGTTLVCSNGYSSSSLRLFLFRKVLLVEHKWLWLQPPGICFVPGLVGLSDRRFKSQNSKLHTALMANYEYFCFFKVDAAKLDLDGVDQPHHICNPTSFRLIELFFFKKKIVIS